MPNERDARNILAGELDEHAELLPRVLEAVALPFEKLLQASVTCLRNGGKILFFGNGGSAADAQHIATELTVRYRKDRPALAAIALTTDTSALTAIGNDFSFEALFSRQVEALARPGDVVIGISTSGNSANVLKGLEAARSVKAVAAGFAGGDGGKMQAVADILLVVPSRTTARIQEFHILFGHALCTGIEERLGYA